MNRADDGLLAKRLRHFEKYPSYKESGAEWLGSLPTHWNVRRLKTIASVRLSNVDKKSSEGEIRVRLCNYVDVYYNNRITPDLEFMNATATPDQVKRFSLRRGDVLITKDSESWTDIAVPSVVTSDLPDVLCGYHLALVRPKPGCHGPFLARAFAAVGPRDQFQIAANGITRFGLTGDAIGDAVIPVPPENEQHVIAAFLDRETARIDALIAKKERVIELLLEKQDATVEAMVTVGVDGPSSPRDGVMADWPPRVPGSWRIVPLKRLLTRLDYGISDSLAGPGDIRVLTMAHIQNGQVVIPAEGSVNEVDESLFLDKDDLLFNRTNSRELVAKVGIFRGSTADRITFASYLVRLRPRANVVPEWLNFVLNSPGLLGRARSIALLSVNQANLNPSKYSQIQIPTPDQQKQLEIANHLHQETTRIERQIASVRRAIDALAEWRAAVVTSAVTGAVDVREEIG